MFTGSSDEYVRKEVIANFDANAFQPKNEYRILVATEVLSEGVNLHRCNIVINYDIPWNPTRLIQRVGRVNRVDTAFDSIHTYNFFPTEESNDVIKLREAAEAKIHAFIEMLGADARLLTEGEEIKSHDLFAKLTSRKTITGEDEAEESELEYLTEIRDVRDQNPELFTRIKRLPRKARSTRLVTRQADTQPEELPSLLTYFRQGQLDKFFLAPPNPGGPSRWISSPLPSFSGLRIRRKNARAFLKISTRFSTRTKPLSILRPVLNWTTPPPSAGEAPTTPMS